MITTLRELRDLIAKNCDFSQPLRVVAQDVGKNAKKHSAVYVDENRPVKITIATGMYDERGSVELAYDEEGEVLMPESLIAALDEVLEEAPTELLKWFYFFYFPMDYKNMFGKIKHINCSLMDTSNIKNVYFADGVPNTLIVEGVYGIGSFDM